MIKKILLTLLLSVNSVLATTVYVESVTGQGLGASEKEAINEFVKSSVLNQPGFDLVRSSSQAEIVLQPKLLKLSNTYFLKMSKTENGKVVKSARMKSKELSDIDRVTDRLVDAMLTGASVEETAKVNNITDAERNQNTNRFEVTRQWIFAFGPAWLNSSNISKSGMLWKLGYEWGLEPNYSLNLAFDGTSFSDSSANFSTLKVGLDYYFTLTKTSPFVGLGLGYGSADVNGCTEDLFGLDCTNKDEEASGWVASVNGGFKFFRTSSVNVGLVAEYAYLFDETKYGNPSRMTVSLAIYY